jgi:hypothetical protein
LFDLLKQEETMLGLLSRRDKGDPSAMSVSGRLAAILRNTDMSAEELQQQTGLNRRVIEELLANDDALMTSVSIREAAAVAQAVGLDLPELVSDDPYENYRTQQISFAVVAEVIKSAVATQDITLRDFEDRAGWELSDVLSRPALLWDYTLEALRDICTAAGINWLDALPRTGD